MARGKMFVAAKREALPPAQSGHDAAVGRGVQEVMRGLFGQAQGKGGAAQIVTAADVNKPVLMLLSLCGKTLEPGGVQKAGNVVAREQMAGQAAELCAGFHLSRLPCFRRVLPVFVAQSQHQEGIEKGVAGLRPQVRDNGFHSEKWVFVAQMVEQALPGCARKRIALDTGIRAPHLLLVGGGQSSPGGAIVVNVGKAGVRVPVQVTQDCETLPIVFGRGGSWQKG